MSQYYDERVSVECRCGLVYLGGDGSETDPLLSAKYNPVTETLDSCKVCANKQRYEGTYVHINSGDLYVVVDIVHNRTTGEVMVFYVKPGEPGRFVRTIEDFNAKFNYIEAPRGYRNPPAR